MVINDTDASNTKLVAEIIKGLSKKLMTWKIMDILKFSRPAKLTYPLTVHQCCANEWVRTDLLEKAYQIKNDPILRMKYVFAFVLSGVHKGPDICRSKAPFNPILGETYQAKNSDGSVIYIEQTEHHPPTFNFSLIGPEKHFELNGFGTINAHLTSLNVIKGGRDGKNILKFKDGSLYTFTNLNTRINGVVMGERTYNYYGDLIIKDYKNKIECKFTLPDEEEQGMLSKMWYGKLSHQYDEGFVEIRQVNPQTKQKELKATGYASWIGQVIFDDKEFWSIFEEPKFWNEKDIPFLLPSDSTKREDLIAILKGDIIKAQAEKEKLEKMQREDQKKRDVKSGKKSVSNAEELE